MIGLGSTQQYSQASSLLNSSESVSESVSQWVSDKHNQWSDSGPIKREYNEKVPNRPTQFLYQLTPSNYQKKCQFHWISSHSFNRFGPFQARSELQQENRTGSWDRVWGTGIFYCNSWNTLDNCPIKIPSLEGIISYSQASIARRKPGRRYLKSAFIRDNLWMIHLCPDHWMTIPKFWPKPIPRLFFYDNKFSETKTETFFRDQIFPKQKPILFFRDQIFRNRNRDFFAGPNFSETDTFFPRPNFSKPKPSKIWQSLETET